MVKVIARSPARNCASDHLQISLDRVCDQVMNGPDRRVVERTIEIKAFTIDDENNIRAYASKKEAADAGTDAAFVSEDELAGIIGGSPASRLVEIWNSLACAAVSTQMPFS